MQALEMIEEGIGCKAIVLVIDTATSLVSYWLDVRTVLS